MSGQDFKEILRELDSAKSALVTAHVSPDADAVGSSAPIVQYLKARGVDVVWYLQDKVPAKFLPLLDSLEPVNKIPSRAVDLVVVTDTAASNRVGREWEVVLKLGSKVINIDHHVSNDAWGDINYIDPTAPSSSLIVHELFESAGLVLPASSQDLLLAGLMDDTGNFRFSNVDARALLVASKMVAAGASPLKIANALYFSTPLVAIKLRAEALSKITVELDDQVGFLSLTRKLLDESGAKESDAEGLIDEVRSISATVASAFMREIEPGKWKLSLRSKTPEIDVNRVAQNFSGGGHVAAAGCTILGSEKEVKAKILECLAAEIKRSEQS